MTFRTRIRFQIRKIYQIGFVGGIPYLYYIYIYKGVIRFPGNIRLYYTLYRSPTRMQHSSPTLSVIRLRCLFLVCPFIFVRFFSSPFVHTNTSSQSQTEQSVYCCSAVTIYHVIYLTAKNFQTFLRTLKTNVHNAHALARARLNVSTCVRLQCSVVSVSM